MVMVEQSMYSVVMCTSVGMPCLEVIQLGLGDVFL